MVDQPVKVWWPFSGFWRAWRTSPEQLTDSRTTRNNLISDIWNCRNDGWPACAIREQSRRGAADVNVWWPCSGFWRAWRTSPEQLTDSRTTRITSSPTFGIAEMTGDQPVRHVNSHVVEPGHHLSIPAEVAFFIFSSPTATSLSLSLSFPISRERRAETRRKSKGAANPR